MIKSLVIDNFKVLNSVMLEFTPFSMLIGDNSVGKSTVLQAITFLKYCCTSNFEKFLDERRLSAPDVCSKFSNKRTLIFSTVLELSGKRIKWDISLIRDRDGFVLGTERLEADGETVLAYNVNGGGSYRLNAKTGGHDSVMDGRFSNSIIQFTDLEKQSEIYPELAAIKAFFTNMETLDLLSPYNMKGSSQGESDVLGMGGERLSSFIKGLPKSDREALMQDVKKFVLAFSSISPITKQYGWVHLEAKETYGGKTIDVSSANISDGVLRIIAFCALRFLDNKGGAILLDEIEDGINNEHLELLVQTLKQIQKEKGVQIIATTHNAVLLDYWIDKTAVDLDAAPDDKQTDSIVFLFRNDNGEVIARNIFSSAAIRDKLSYLFPGEIILNMTKE